MRFTSVSVALALVLVSLSASLHGQQPDDQIDPQSIALMKQGVAARSAGNLAAANDALEAALVVDPRNRQAFIELARVARGQELNGKAIRYYREALLLNPSDLTALRGQGEAMVAKGAVARAEQNLDKIKKICKKQCSDADKLAAVIAKGPPITQTAQTTAEEPAEKAAKKTD